MENEMRATSPTGALATLNATLFDPTALKRSLM
jgi:hypothetical protein